MTKAPLSVATYFIKKTQLLQQFASGRHLVFDINQSSSEKEMVKFKVIQSCCLNVDGNLQVVHLQSRYRRVFCILINFVIKCITIVM